MSWPRRPLIVAIVSANLREGGNIVPSARLHAWSSRPPVGWMRQAAQRGLELLLPPACRACEAPLPGGDDPALLCATCLSLLAPPPGALCRRCAARVPDFLADAADCPRCRQARLRFDRALVLGENSGAWHELTVRMKRDRRGLLARAVAELAWSRQGSELRDWALDVVTPIPPRPGAWLRQANLGPETLARDLAAKLGVPVASRLLGMRRGTAPQVGLSRAGRFQNMAGKFYVRRGHVLDAAHVLLVDDALTTGATCSEAARALRRSGAARVSVLAVVRTAADRLTFLPARDKS